MSSLLGFMNRTLLVRFLFFFVDLNLSCASMFLFAGVFFITFNWRRGLQMVLWMRQSGAHILVDAHAAFRTLQLTTVVCATVCLFSDCVDVATIFTFHKQFRTILNTFHIINGQCLALVVTIMDDIQLMCALPL